MTLDATNVEVAVTGAVYLAPLGTTLPTSSADELDEAFKDVGYISEDGITETPEEDTQEIRAWQNGDVVRRLLTSHEIQYGFTMIEINEVSLTAYYGNYDAGTVRVTGAPLPRQSMVIDVIDEGKLRRRVAPVAGIVERGEVSLTNSEATGLEVTVSCYPDATETPTKVYIYPLVDVDSS